jgi:hypothetical protein
MRMRHIGDKRREILLNMTCDEEPGRGARIRRLSAALSTDYRRPALPFGAESREAPPAQGLTVPLLDGDARIIT